MIGLGSLQVWLSVQSSFRRQDMPQKTDYRELKGKKKKKIKKWNQPILSKTKKKKIVT